MTKQQRLVLVVSILASVVVFLDGAIVNVALPAIQRSLGGGLAVQQWVVDAYMLTLGSLILVAGSLSDLFGRRKIMGFGLIGFGAASLLCALAPNGSALIIFRGLQGGAGALLVPSSLALIISAFSGPAQGKAIGSWTAWTGISFIIGPLLGGFLVDYSSWRWIFAVNLLPIAATLYLLKGVSIGESDKNAHPKVDYFGTVLCALGLGGPVFALIEQPHYGWGDARIFLPLALGAALFIGFLVYEKTADKPMLPLSLFKNRNFSVGNVATLLIYAGLSAGTFLLVVYLQQVSGYSAFRAGLALLPVTIIMFFVSPRMGALAGKLGPRLFMGLGPIIAAFGMILLSRHGLYKDYWTQFLPGIVVFGLGLATTVAPLTAAILGDVAQAQAGIASAVNNAMARIAGLIAIAAVGALVAAQFSSHLDKFAQNWHLDPVTIRIAKQTPLQITPPKPYQNDMLYGNIYKEGLLYASANAYRDGLYSIAGLLAAGGLVSLAGIRNSHKK